VYRAVRQPASPRSGGEEGTNSEALDIELAQGFELRKASGSEYPEEKAWGGK